MEPNQTEGTSAFRHVLRNVLRGIKWLLLGLLFIIVTAIVALLLPPVQKYAINKGTDWFNNTTGGELSIQDVDVRLPFYIRLDGVQLNGPDQKQIVKIDEFRVSLGWRMIFDRTIRIDRIEMAGLNANLYSDVHGNWNYGFIVDAFSDSTAAPDTTSAGSPWDVSIGNVKLSDTQLAYFDYTSRDSITTSIGKVFVNFNRFTLSNMVFLAESVELQDSKSFIQISPGDDNMKTDSAIQSDPAAETELPEIALTNLTLTNHDLKYHITDGSMDMHLSLGLLEAVSKDIDLQNNRYDIRSLALHNTTFEMQSIASETIDTTAFDYNIFIPFNISADKLDAAGNQVLITTKGVNNEESVMDLHGIAFDISDFSIKPNQYALKAQSISGAYGDDIRLTDLQVSLDVRPESIEVANLALTFGQSALKGKIKANFESLQKLAEEGKFEHIAVDIPRLRLHPGELKSINRLAGIHDTSMVSIPSVLSLSTRFSGDRQKINVPLFNAQMGGSEISIKGHSAGAELAKHKVTLNELAVHLMVTDIVTYLPSDFDLSPYPDTYTLTGSATASPEAASLKADLIMDIGDVRIDAETGGWDAKSFPIVGTLESNRLDLSRITGFDSLLVVFDINADLQEVTSQHRSGEITVDLHEIDYGKYRLNDTYARVDVLGDVYDYILEVNDSSVIALLEGQATLGDSIKVKVDGDVKGIDLEYLGITEKDFRTQLHFSADYQMVDSFMQGNLLIDRTIVIREDKRTDIDPISASFALLSDSSGANLTSEWINLTASSNLTLENIITHIRALFKDEPDDEIRKDGYFNIQVETADSDLITEIFPQIKSFDPSMVSIDYSAQTRYLDARAKFPSIRYEDIEIDSMKLDLLGSAGQIAGTFEIGRIAYDSLALMGIQLGLTPADEGNDFSFQVNNGMDTAQYFFNANVKHIVDADNQYWRIDPAKSFVLDGKEWTVDSLAQITLKDSLYGIEDFNIRRNKNYLSIHTPMDDPVLHLKANNFSLVYLSKLFTLEQNLLEGRLNLNMDIHTDGTFEGRADINGLNIFGADFGRFDLVARSENGNYAVDAQLEGPTMDMEAKGTLTSLENDVAQIDVKTFLTRLDFKSLHRLFPSIISSSSGIATGALNASGTTADPMLSGNVLFKDISMQMVDNRARYILRDEQINLEPGRIVFPSFTIRDSASNRMVVDGEIRHTFFLNRAYDLTIKSDNFTLVDLLPGEDPFVYGKLIVGTDITVSGSDLSTVIRSNVALKNGSGIVFQMPEERYDDMSFDGLVEWVTFDEKVRETNKIIDARKGEKQQVQESSSIDLSGALKIDPETKLKIIIDPLAGDNLDIQGGGTLGLGYDRSGQLNLNGTYRVTSGSYEMTFYNIVKRSFSISDGSAIMWNGDPYNPEMNITAVYKTRIPLASLMGSQASASAANESLRRPADFELHMTLTGGLEQTDVAFEIKLGEKSRGMLSGAADARVTQINENETELNRQVFAMLVLNTFVNDAAPSSGGEALANEARNSASQILTNQLNTLTNKFIGGAVDLSFDMMSYQGAGGNPETDLSIDVSKSLFNERIVIKVGSTVPIEGNNTAGANGSNELITNIIVEYKITADGRYNFKVFRKEDLDDILVGRLTRTGVGVMFRREFDSNSDIFKLTEEEIKLKEAMKESSEQEEK